MEDRKVTKKDIAFGRHMQRIRKSRNITQEELANKTSLSVTFIGLLETGQRRPSLESLKKIASALKIMVKDLINY